MRETESPELSPKQKQRLEFIKLKKETEAEIKETIHELYDKPGRPRVGVKNRKGETVNSQGYVHPGPPSE